MVLFFGFVLFFKKDTLIALHKKQQSNNNDITLEAKTYNTHKTLTNHPKIKVEHNTVFWLSKRKRSGLFQRPAIRIKNPVCIKMQKRSLQTQHRQKYSLEVGNITILMFQGHNRCFLKVTRGSKEKYYKHP